MKKHLSLWLLMAAFCLYVSCAKAQTFINPEGTVSHQIKIVYPGYTSYWNALTLIPDSVIWVCIPHSKATARAGAFHSSGGRINLSKDYARSGFDIGHNCNASDENANSTDEYNSFDFVNTFPQKPNCNRLVWLQLENYTRAISVKFGACRVKVSWLGVDTKLQPNGVVVPLFCVKELYYNSTYEKYVIPNKDTVNRHPFTYYKIK